MDNLIEKTHRILIIDDNQMIHEDYRKILEAPDRAIHASDAEALFFHEDAWTQKDTAPAIDVVLDSAYQGQEAIAKVELARRENRPYSMAFVDMRMPPGWDGLRTVEELWKVQPDLQIVMCTAYSDHTWEDICARVGYSDKLLILKKPFDSVEVAQLVIALTKKWALTRDARLRQRDLERMVEERTVELKYAALRDGLTGLSNRTRFSEQLDHALARINRKNDVGASIMLIDLDCFKGVNDTLGHPGGDQLVKGVARRLEAVVRETDCVARLGGDEFAILQTPVNGGEGGSSLAKRLFEAMEEPFDIDGNRVQVGMSCGISLAPQDGTNATDLMRNADLALYRAKADGRNCFRYFEEEMDRRIRHRREIAGQLKQAIEAGQLELYYQPILDAKSGEISSMEGLLRWNHPKRGVLAPGEFLAVAEETGLTGPIGKWVIEQACSDAIKFPDGVSVAVNISAVQFDRNNLLTSVRDSLTRSGLAPSRLTLEIVESVVLQKSDIVVHTLDQLHTMGVRIAMDDFGTGYSSLSYLRMFPFDRIKLDRSFVRDAPGCGESMAIIQAVAMLGKCLNLELTAEGVETQEHLDSVLEAGYDSTQGYFHARPMPLGQALEFFTCREVNPA